MSAHKLLEALLDLIRQQCEHVIAGNAEAVLEGAGRHEELLAELATARLDLSQGQLREWKAAIDLEKVRLSSLLTSETVRTDFLLRLILGGGNSRNPGGYPGVGLRTETDPRVLNHRA